LAEGARNFVPEIRRQLARTYSDPHTPGVEI
jgi:hypothetical protein